MTTLLTSPPRTATLADLLDRLGGISARRVRLHPPPGTATEQDVLDCHDRENRLCELVDGTLVEKVGAFRESCVALELGRQLKNFVKPRNLGLVAGADGMMRLASGLVRIPDLSFISWDQIPDRRMPSRPIPNVAPTLAVEVLSEGNTDAEMERKRREYFDAGAKLVWMIDPDTRTITVYEAPDSERTLAENETLEGGNILSGFTLPLRDLFAELDQVEAR